MKLIYITNARLPTEKAHGIQIMKMCEAFASYRSRSTQIEPPSPDTQIHAEKNYLRESAYAEGKDLRVSASTIELELLIPKRHNPEFKNTDPFDYYKVKRIFKIKKLPCLDLIQRPIIKYFGRLGLWIEIFSFSLSAFLYLLFKKADIIYSRDLPCLWLLSFFKKNIFFEIHGLPKHLFLYKGVLKRINGIITITHILKNFLIKKKISSEKILVAPDGVDLKKFKIRNKKLKIKEKLGLPQDKKIVLYTGHLYKWKGVYTLLEASKYLPENVLVVFVGGTDYDIKNFKFQVLRCRQNGYGASAASFKNILVVGYRPHSEIPYWLKAADVLVLPNSAKKEISKCWTSPMKMFEYMASQRPIVASDLPSIREILYDRSRYTQIKLPSADTQIHAEKKYLRESAYAEGKNPRVSASTNAILVEPDNPKALAEGIEFVLKNPDLSAKISKQAYKDVKKYTWKKRAKKILNFISINCCN